MTAQAASHAGQGAGRYAEIIARQSRMRLRADLIFWGLLGAAAVLSAIAGGFDPRLLIEGAPRFGDFFVQIMPELRLDVLGADQTTRGSMAWWFHDLDKWLNLLWLTIQMAVLATFLGAAFAFGLSFLASRNLAPFYWVYWVTRRGLELLRTIPEIVLAMIFVWVLGIGPAAGILAIAIHSVGTLGKLFAEVNENVDEGPLDACRAVGGNFLQRIRFGVVPQMLPSAASYTMLRFEINVRSATVIGFVSAGGIGEEFVNAIKFSAWSDVSAIGILIIATVVAVDLISERLRHRMIGLDARA